ncbi:MAG: sel1 repeat family protein [Lentisphaeria bacterium]|nr:sel1 repeat family protein [Lentisphaeria bacterium]
MLKEKIFCCVLSAVFFAGDPAFAAEAKNTTKDVSTLEAAIKHFDSGDREGAFLLLKNAENSGDPRILSRLGWCYYFGSGVEENREAAYQYFKRSIDDPDGFGIDGMGICYQHGVGVEKDLAKAEEMHKKALAKGNLYALGNLAFLYGRSGNDAEAIRYWEMCYKSKLPPFWLAFSAYMLGNLHENPKEKISWWEEAGKRGFSEALLELSKFYNFGDTVEIDMSKSLEYAKMYAGDTGDKAPYAAVAFDWAIEKMVLQDMEMAAKYMLIAADNGEKRAYWYAFKLSGNGKYALLAAESGDERGFAEAGNYLMNRRKENPQAAEEYRQRAVNYYRKAIDLQGADSLNAICNLAAAYAEKQDAENIEKALKLYQEAACWHFPRGLSAAGVIYAMFSQMEIDDEAKRKYALLALEHLASAFFYGDKDAADDLMEKISPLAEKYSDTPEAKFFNGIKLIMRIPQDQAEAKVIAEGEKLIKAAADAGCIQAMMVQGTYIAPNPEVAVQYLQKAAAAGNLYAKWLLGSTPQFAQILPVADRLNYLKELIAVGNKNSRNLYAQLLDEQGKTAMAIKEYQAAIAEGHAGSMTLLYLLLLRQGDVKMIVEAWELLRQAIEKHDGLAQCFVAERCLDSPSFSPRFGMHLLMKGIVDGTEASYYYLHRIAMNYAQGKGVTKSAENAKRIAGKMIEQGYAYGFYTMGVLYRIGVFGKADTEKAKEYYKKGAEQGVQECIEALKTLSSGRK